MDKPLKGIKVLDLTTFVAAPCTGRFLADLGADVIKIEKNSGDSWRYTGISYCPNRFSHEENPVFDIYNAGKRVITLNLKTSEGIEVFHKLLSESDIFLTNTRLPALKRLGISYDELKEKYPKLIYAMVTGYGEKGPDAELPAFDTTAFWSRCGMLRDMAVIDDNDNYMPSYAPSGVGDTVSAYLLLAEVVTALYHRTKTGKGQLVKSCLYHNGIFTFGTMQITSQRPWGRVFPMKREQHSIPGGYYKCKDGEWIFIATGMVNVLVQQMCTAIGRPDLIDDERYNTSANRYKNRREYYNIFREAFLKKTSDEWLQIAKELDFAMIKMKHFADVSEDEQAWANGFLEEVTFENGQIDIMPQCPIEMESVGSGLKTVPAPKLGANTSEVLKELGYTDQEIRELDRKGVTTVKLIK